MGSNGLVAVLFLVAGCASRVAPSDGGAPSFHLPVHVVVGPWLPLQPGAAFAVRVDAANGTAVETTTDDSGRADIVLDPAGGPWTLSVAADWYRGLSIVGIEPSTVLGDLYVEPVNWSMPTDHVNRRLSGAVTFPATLREGVWLSSEYDGRTSAQERANGSFDTVVPDFQNAPPVQLTFVEWDPWHEHTVNAMLLSIARTGHDLVVAGHMPDPPEEHDRVVHVSLPTVGLLTANTLAAACCVTGLLRGNVDHVGTLETGGGSVTRNGIGVDVVVETFGSLVPDAAQVRFGFGDMTGFSYVSLSGSPPSIGEVRALTLSGTTLQDVNVSWDASGYDTVTLSLDDYPHLYHRTVYGIARGSAGTLRAPPVPYAFQPPSSTTSLSTEGLLSRGAEGRHPWNPPDVAPWESAVGPHWILIQR